MFGMAPGTEGMLIVPPTIQAMMSGVKMAMIEPSGRVILLYTDDTTESAILEPTAEPCEFFALVSAVQSKRQGVERIER